MNFCPLFACTEMSVGQVAAKIANLKIDVLVDLTGWTLFPCTEILAMHVS
jgi:predicted O-linked N-acetylglucosamine transferase (SPINDLY family)